MALVIERLVENAELTQTADGTEMTEVYLVTEIAGNPEQILALALDAPGIPAIGDPHPVLSTIHVYQRNVRPASGSSVAQCHVSVNYRSGPLTNAYQLEVGSSTTRLEKVFDIHGQEILVEYLKTSVSDEGVETTDLITQAVPVQVEIPISHLKVTRWQIGDPLTLSRAFVGTMNASPFVGDPAHTWLCTRIDGTLEDLYTLRYRVLYEFQRAPFGGSWDADVVFRDPDTGQTPTDIVIGGNGAYTVQVYPVADFNQLPLFVQVPR